MLEFTHAMPAGHLDSPPPMSPLFLLFMSSLTLSRHFYASRATLIRDGFVLNNRPTLSFRTTPIRGAHVFVKQPKASVLRFSPQKCVRASLMANYEVDNRASPGVPEISSPSVRVCLRITIIVRRKISVYATLTFYKLDFSE